MKHAVRGPRRSPSWMPFIASVLAFLLAVYGSIAVDMRPPKHRRGLLHNASLSDKLLPSQCGLCSLLNTTTTDPSAPNNRYQAGSMNVAILISSRQEPELMVLAAGLLSYNISVTIISMNDQQTTALISSKILSAVHCHKQQEAHDMLMAKSIEVRSPSSGTNVVAIDYLEAQIQGVQAVLFAGKRDRVLPHVLVMESRSLGGIFVAEKYGIPSIILAKQFTMLEAGFVPTLNYFSSGTSWWRQLKSIPTTYYESLSSTWLFAKISQRRKAIGLGARRSLSDVWRAATGIMVIPNLPFLGPLQTPLGFNPDRYPTVLDLDGPLVAPAIPCTPHFQINSVGPAVGFLGVVLPPSDLGMMHKREILRGLTLAKASLDSYQGTCGGDSKSPVCWNGPTDLQVLWLETSNATLPTILPSFVKTLHSNMYHEILVQALVQNSTKAVFSIGDCDTTGQINMALKLPVLCLLKEKPRLKTKWEPERGLVVEYVPKIEKRVLAAQLLRLLPRALPTSSKKWNQTEEDVEKSFSSMRQAVAFIRKAGFVSTRDGHEPEALGSGVSINRIIQTIFQQAMRKKPQVKQQSTLHNFLFLMAGSFLLLGTVYLVTTRLLIAHTRHLRAPRLLRNHPRLSDLEILLLRKSEMDQAFDEISRWWQGDEPISFPTTNGCSGPSANEKRRAIHNGRTTHHVPNGRQPRKKQS